MNSSPVKDSKTDSNISPKKEIKIENKIYTNNPDEEVKESISISENEVITKKVIKVQEENINGNYGRIYIQESSSNRELNKPNTLNDKTKEKPVIQKETKKTIISKNDDKKNDKNKRKNYVISVDNKYIKKNEDERTRPKKYNLRRKSIDRGGDYKNVQVTHIIYSSIDINFHIIDPLVTSTDEARRKYMIKIDDKNRNGRNGKVKVTYNCSCDNIKTRPSNKYNLTGKTNVVSHRHNIKPITKTEYEIKRTYKEKERKEGKEGKDSIIKMNMRNKDNTNKGNTGGGQFASYKKRNEKNNSVNINIKKN